MVNFRLLKNDAGFLMFLLTTLTPNSGISQKSIYIHETSVVVGEYSKAN